MITSQYIRGRPRWVSQRGIHTEEPRGELLGYDDFERDDETPPTGWTVYSGTWAVANRTLKQTALAVDRIAYLNQGPFSNSEHRVVYHPSQDGGDAQAGVAHRLQDENNLMNCELDVAAQVLRIQKRWKGTWENVASTGTFTITRDQQYQLKLIAMWRYYYLKGFNAFGSIVQRLFYRDQLNVMPASGRLAIKCNRTGYFDEVEAYDWPVANTFSDSFQTAGLFAYCWQTGGLPTTGWLELNGEYLLWHGDRAYFWLDREEFMAENVRVQADVYLKGVTNEWVGLCVRITDQNNCYFLGPDSFNDRLYIYKRVAGSDTSLGYVSVAIDADHWYTCTLEVDGPDLTGKIYDGATLLATVTATDPALIYGSAGWWIDGDDHRIRNWSVTVLNRVGLENYANLGSAQASSKYGVGYEASKAIDEAITTRWASASATASWIRADLGSAMDVAEISTDWENAMANTLTAAYIEWSDDDSVWTTEVTIAAFTITTGGHNVKVWTVNGGSHRYWRIRATASTSNVMSLWEMQIFKRETV